MGTFPKWSLLVPAYPLRKSSSKEMAVWMKDQPSKTFDFGTGGRIRQSPRKIDVSVLDHARGF
jgi:hypothetical protein